MNRIAHEQENNKKGKAYTYWRMGLLALGSMTLLWYSIVLGVESSYLLRSHSAPVSFFHHYFFLATLTLVLLFNIGVSILFGVFEKPRRWHLAEIMVLILLCGAQWLNTSVLPSKREAALSVEFHRFVARAHPVVDALHAYERDHGYGTSIHTTIRCARSDLRCGITMMM